MIAALSKVIKRMHYPLSVMLTCVRWYVAHQLSANLSSSTGPAGTTQNILECFHASKTCLFNSLLMRQNHPRSR
jgi:hypothetical protein